MGLFSWPPSASTSTSPSSTPSPSALTPSVPTLQPQTLPVDPEPPVAPSKPRRRPKRTQVPSNAPVYIFSVAGVAFTVGLLISVRQVRKLKLSSTELSKATALAQGITPLDPLVQAAAQAGPRAKRIGTKSILSPNAGGSGGVLAIPPGKATSAFTLPPTNLPRFDAIPPFLSSPAIPTAPTGSVQPAVVSTLASSVAPTASTPSARAPLFPPSKSRVTLPTAASSSLSEIPTAAQPVRPTLSGLLRASRLPNPEEEDAPAPPAPAKNILYAFGALGVATAIAVTVVGVPSALVCWWLDVKELEQFRPALEAKLGHLFPSLSTSLRRPDPADPLAIPVPIFGERFRWTTQKVLDQNEYSEEEMIEELEDFGFGGGTWGEWWERLKSEFELERVREEDEQKVKAMEKERKKLA